ncbi:MAG: cation-translocating P-type ATPase [Deltaproteobacteria bacterium]|jgi:heavy metal translocating P-type ATPase|nr:cation-translocating P-type ATPase [Deltaproteobacteria bacterium]
MEKIISFFSFKGRKALAITLISAVALLVDFIDLFPNAPFSPSYVAVILCGLPILLEAGLGLFTRFDVTADVLVSMALLASICIGEIFAAGEVAFIMTLGSMLEERTVRKAREGLENLVNLSPVTARVVRDGSVTTLKAREVLSGDIVRVLAGEVIPVDGEIVFGRTAIDQSLLTGESIPVDKGVGDEVYSGTLNQLGTFDFKATKVGEDSSIIRMIRLVESAEASKTPIVRIMDRWAGYIVFMALAACLITYFITGESLRAVTILVVFCPCALVLATPTAIMAGIGNASRQGIIISSGEALERLAKVQVAAFDKTGTITYGQAEVTSAIAAPGISLDNLWSLAATCEERSEHPIGKAIRREAIKNNVKILEITQFELIEARGVRAVADNQEILGGSLELFEEKNWELDLGLISSSQKYLKMGQAVVFIGVSGRAAGFLALADTIRKEAKETIKAIEAEGVKTVLLTGDHKEAAITIASEAGITFVRAELKPQDKAKIITEDFPRRAWDKVLMVGDGLNDAPALKSAYVSLAMGRNGSGLAAMAADGVLVRDDLKRIPHLLRLAKKTTKTIKVNITLSMIMNFFTVSLAAGGLMGPVAGALAHNLGAFLIVFNSARLLNFKYHGFDKPPEGIMTSAKLSQPRPT